jgi:hypothetical protein
LPVGVDVCGDEFHARQMVMPGVVDAEFNIGEALRRPLGDQLAELSRFVVPDLAPELVSPGRVLT